jgi:hypothetical protein
MQISASRGDQAGALFAAHQGEEFPTARTSIGMRRDIGYAAKGARHLRRALTKRRLSARKARLMHHVRLSGSPESASSSRFEACRTSKQTTMWARRKKAYVQPAPTSRQRFPGTFIE